MSRTLIAQELARLELATRKLGQTFTADAWFISKAGVTTVPPEVGKFRALESGEIFEYFVRCAREARSILDSLLNVLPTTSEEDHLLIDCILTTVEVIEQAHEVGFLGRLWEDLPMVGVNQVLFEGLTPLDSRRIDPTDQQAFDLKMSADTDQYDLAKERVRWIDNLDPADFLDLPEDRAPEPLYRKGV